MTEKDNKIKSKNTLSLSSKKLELKKVVNSGQIRQSFPHGKSKAVSFEVKKKRFLDKESLAKEKQNKIKSDLSEQTGLSSEEIEARKALLKQSDLGSGKLSNEMSESQKRLAEIEKERLSQAAQSRQKPLKSDKVDSEKRERKDSKKSVDKKAVENKSDVSSRAVASSIEDVPSPKETDKRVKSEYKDKVVAAGDSDSSRKTLSMAKREKHKKQHFSIEDALNDDNEEKQKSLASVRRAREKKKAKQTVEQQSVAIVRDVVIPETISVQELSNRMAVRAGEVIKKLMMLGVAASGSQDIDADTAELVATEFGHKVTRISDSDIENDILPVECAKENQIMRPPVVTVMGHVDHGKTSLLDSIRKSDVVSSESGGITQHIGSYQVETKSGCKISFIDTPGHEAFSEMRARGADITDIVVLVVAADDGVKTQTIEAINHAKAANVPIIVVINKIDKPEANPMKIKNELLSHELVVEDLGGEIQVVEVSATQGLNIDKLEEAILLQAEMLELTADNISTAVGSVIESKVEKGKGTVTTVLIQRGILNVGDVFASGEHWGKVKVITDSRGCKLSTAEPSMPVEIIGFSGSPLPGESFVVVQDEAKAREVAEYRAHKAKQKKALVSRKISKDLLMQGGADERKTLSVIIKSDVQGSAEATIGSFSKIINTDVNIKVLHSGVGGINESDVTLASTCNALIIGFNVRANNQARNLAQNLGIEIRYYSIIYDVIDDVKKILSGMLDPELREEIVGYAEVRNVFNISKAGKVAGCYVTTGEIRSNASVRLLRDDVVIHTGEIQSLKRFKDDAKSVKEGYECGITLDKYQDIKVGDKFECFAVEKIARTVD